MRSRTHLHSSTTLLVVTVGLLLGSMGVVHAQQRPAPHRAEATASAQLVAALHAAAPPPPTTTTSVATTTTSVAPTTTTAPPPPAPTTTSPRAARPAATPATAPPAPARPADPVAYAMDIVRQYVPAPWLAMVPVKIQVIGGRTSWSSWGGLIQIDEWHLSIAPRAVNTLVHEWGHQAAWRYGTDSYNGAPPAGFPYDGAERWADCVAEALTGTYYPTPGLGHCPSDGMAFVRSWIGAGPGTPLR